MHDQDLMTLKLDDGTVAHVQFDENGYHQYQDICTQINDTGWRIIAWEKLETSLETETAGDFEEAMTTLWYDHCPELFNEDQETMEHLPELTKEMLLNSQPPGATTLLHHSGGRYSENNELTLTTGADDAAALAHLTVRQLTKEQLNPETALNSLKATLNELNAVARGDVYCLAFTNSDGEGEDEGEDDDEHITECYGGIVSEDGNLHATITEQLQQMGLTIVEEIE